MTALSDAFTRANESPLAAPWAAVGGVANLTTNRAVLSTSPPLDRYESDLASTDHYVECALSDIPSTAASGPTARMNTAGSLATLNCYHGRINVATPAVQLFKVINGTFTQLGSDVAYTPSAGDVVRLTCSGSTITVSVNGVSKISLTDTSVTTGVRGGFRMLRSGGGAVVGIDNWAAADLAVDPVAKSLLMYATPARMASVY